jgi:1-aminocyclopropane-1-carboxylate deaminase/D-cysteine desulfhydrase-like pyridoxal-dependent ACC family enzyme
MTYTPVTSAADILLKREDMYRAAGGVNGGKLRACMHLLQEARAKGYTQVVSAASVLSPQSAMAAVVARYMDMKCHVIVGGTGPDTVFRHPAMQIARSQGACFHYIKAGYNPQLQKAGRTLTSTLQAAWQLPYGITPSHTASSAEVEAFHAVGAEQVNNLPAHVQTLVIPFGSGNSAASILYGLSKHAPAALQRIILMSIGPDKRPWLRDRLEMLQVTPPCSLEFISLYPGWARYGTSMSATLGDVIMHPTYEGKIVRWCQKYAPEWWTRSDEKTCMWIVGGPL